MRAVIETVFDIFYLVTVLTVGIRMIRGSKAGTQFRLFGLMAVVLGAGDSFHLVPRALALCTTGLENYAVPLGLGKWITSVTMTVFYVLLYYVWRKRYQIEGQKNVTAAVYALSAVRIVLCMMPQNQWLTNHTPLAWGILRNVPFALLGLLIIVLFYRSAKQNNDKAFRWMWLTIVLSFGFYIPVVLWADVVPMILGVQGNLWTEYIPDFRQVKHMLLPRLAAIAETGWAYDRKDFEDFSRRMRQFRKVYDRAGYNYATYFFDGKDE